MSDKISVKGRLVIRNAETKEILYEKENLITDVGLGLLADHLDGGTVAIPNWFALGDNASPVAVSDTILSNELFRDVISSHSSLANVYSAVCLVNLTDAQFVWKEFGILTAASGGVLFNHLNIDYDHPSQGVNVEMTYSVTFTRA